jgi:hypothetical protein
MWESLVAYGCWVLQGLAIFLWAHWAAPARKDSSEGEWMFYLQ